MLGKLYGLRYPKWAEQVRFAEKGGALVLSYRWIHSTQGYVPMFLALWMAALFMAGSCFVAWLAVSGGGAPLLRLFLAFIAAILFTGFPLFVNVLGMLVNSSAVRLDKEQLIVTRGPIPWTGGFARKVADIRSIEAREVSIFCDLVMTTTKGKEKRLVRTIHEFEKPLQQFARRAGDYLGAPAGS